MPFVSETVRPRNQEAAQDQAQETYSDVFKIKEVSSYQIRAETTTSVRYFATGCSKERRKERQNLITFTVDTYLLLHLRSVVPDLAAQNLF